MPIVDRLLLSRIGQGASVLDVCCGTGQFTELLRKRGYRMEGIDASDAMIAFARQNAPQIPFTVADARDFSLARRFEAAYSVFESLNHVPDLKGLALGFSCVRQHLEPGAPFLFDLNREDAYVQFWNDRDGIVTGDNVCVMVSSYDEATRIGTCDVTVFDLDDHSSGCWRRTDFTVRQTCHDINEVANALADSGFCDVTLYDARDAGMIGDIAYARTFFLAIA